VQLVRRLRDRLFPQPKQTKHDEPKQPATPTAWLLSLVFAVLLGFLIPYMTDYLEDYLEEYLEGVPLYGLVLSLLLAGLAGLFGAYVEPALAKAWNRFLAPYISNAYRVIAGAVREAVAPSVALRLPNRDMTLLLDDRIVLHHSPLTGLLRIYSTALPAVVEIVPSGRVQAPGDVNQSQPKPSAVRQHIGRADFALCRYEVSVESRLRPIKLGGIIPIPTRLLQHYEVTVHVNGSPLLRQQGLFALFLFSLSSAVDDLHGR